MRTMYADDIALMITCKVFKVDWNKYYEELK